MLRKCLCDKQIPACVVEASPDVDIDVENGSFGIVLQPANHVADRVVLLMMLLFSLEFDLARKWDSEDDNWRACMGIPLPIVTFLNQITSKQPLHAPAAFACTEEHAAQQSLTL